MSTGDEHSLSCGRFGLNTGILSKPSVIVCLGIWTLGAPLSVASDYVILVDTSDSMTKRISKTDPRIRITTVQEALRNFIGALPSDSRVCLMSFNTGIRSEQEVVLRGVQERQEAIKWIDHLATEDKKNGRTYLWTSLRRALEVATRYAEQNPKQIVVLRALTDGQDSQGVTTLAKVLKDFPSLDGKRVRSNLVILGDLEIKISADKYLLLASEQAKEAWMSPASLAPSEKPLWLVDRFTARKEWLGSQPQLEALGKDWGAALAVYVEHALKKRSIRTDVSKSELTEAEIRRLIQEGLKYYCGGELELLETSNTAAGDVTAKLTVTYRLQKLFQNKLRTIQQSRISVSQISSRTVSEEDLRRLLEAVAEEITKRVVTDIPADLLASRG